MASSGNFCTWNAVMAASNFTGTLTVGNTKSQPTSDCTGFGTMAMTTGKKWYFEARNCSAPKRVGKTARHSDSLFPQDSTCGREHCSCLKTLEVSMARPWREGAFFGKTDTIHSF